MRNKKFSKFLPLGYIMVIFVLFILSLYPFGDQGMPDLPVLFGSMFLLALYYPGAFILKLLETGDGESLLGDTGYFIAVVAINLSFFFGLGYPMDSLVKRAKKR